MPKYVIHIGPAKTGSKYLQSSLFGLRAEMLKDGINYADNWWTAKRPGISHAPLMEKLQAFPDAETETAFRNLEASDHKVVVLSCEGFTALTSEQLAYWRKLMGNSPVEIVFYCRRWSDRIPSSWQQDIKEGRFETLPELCVRTFRNPLSNRGINYALIWEKFAAVFGKESLRLISYSNLRDHKIDMVRHFLGAILKWRDDIALPKDNIVTNVSPDAFQTETLRALNYLHFVKTGKTDFRVRASYFKNEYAAAGGGSGLNPNVDKFGEQHANLQQRLTEAMRANLVNLRIDDAAAVFDKVDQEISKYRDFIVTKELGDEMFRKRANDFEYVKPDYLIWPSAAEALHQIYATLEL